MCGLFGFSDPKHTLTQKQIRRLTGSLATASEQRGRTPAGSPMYRDRRFESTSGRFPLIP